VAAILVSVSSGANVDFTKPFRGMSRLVELVRFVYDTSPDNETDWIEWKIGLELTKPAGRFAVAKQIVGFSNRDPGRAATHADGCGFMVLGAEPGRIEGQPGMDPAKLEDGLRPYVGTDGPAWSPQTVRVDDKDVVVITVEPPQWGDPIHTLRKQYENYKNGEVFVRRPGGTHPASSAEHQALQRRLLNQPTEGLELVIESIGDPIPRVDLSDDAVEEWVTRERDRLHAPMNADLRVQALQAEAAKRIEGDTEAVALRDPLAGLRSKMPDLGISAPVKALRDATSEDRSPDDYRAQVDQYLSSAKASVRDEAVNQCTRVVESLLALRVTNTSDRNLDAVEIIVSFSGPISADPSIDVTMPRPPRLWGPRTLGFTAPRIHIGEHSLIGSGSYDLAIGYSARNTGTSTTIEFDAFDLRPHRTVDLGEVPVVVNAALSGTIEGTWTATATNRDGQANGAVTVVLADETVTLAELLSPTDE
jgi:hypothetical protein